MVGKQRKTSTGFNYYGQLHKFRQWLVKQLQNGVAFEHKLLTFEAIMQFGITANALDDFLELMELAGRIDRVDGVITWKKTIECPQMKPSQALPGPGDGERKV